MSAIGFNEYELEDELESMYESEDEFEDESEAESEQFFGGLLSLAKRAIQSPALRKVAMSAAKSALGSILPQGEGEFEDEYEDEYEMEDEFEDEEEDEYEDEDEFEDEYEAETNPIRRIYPAAMMEHLGHAAMEAESEDEAKAFVRALVPLAAHRIPHAAPVLKKTAPHLLKGVAKVAKTLLKSKATRPLVRALPTIVKQTAMHIARQSHGGRVPISPKKVLKILAHHTAKTIGSPKRAVAAYVRSKALDKKAHKLGTPIKLIRGQVHYAKPLAGGGHGRLRKVGWPGRNRWTRRGLHGLPGHHALAIHGVPRIAGHRTHAGLLGHHLHGVPTGYRRSHSHHTHHSCNCCCCGGRR
jgi:hypothetical protein